MVAPHARRPPLPRPGRLGWLLLQVVVAVLFGTWWWFGSGAAGCNGVGPRSRLLPGCRQQAPPFPDKGSVRGKPARGRTRAAGLVIEERCSSKHAEELASRWQELHAATPNFTACPGIQWLHRLHELSPSPGKVFVDVGSAEGYASAALFGLWAPQLNFTPHAVRGALPSLHCGACDECEQRVAPAGGQPAAAEGPWVLGVEPHPLRFSRLAALRERFFTAPGAGAQWHLMQAATGSGREGDAVTRCDAAPHGPCRIGALAQRGADPAADVVPVWAVDELLGVHGVTRVDLLRLDVEGHELAALDGALGSLARGGVGLLAFAYSGKLAWRPGALGAAVARLDELGFACYLLGKDTPEGSLARLSGCWHAAYERTGPATVVCAARRHELYSHLERLTLRYGLRAKRYFRDDAGTRAAQGGAQDGAQQAQGGGAQAARGGAQQGQPADPVELLLAERADPLQPRDVLPQNVENDLLLTQEQLAALQRRQRARAEDAWAAFRAGARAAATKARLAGRPLPETSNVTAWAAAPDAFTFRDPQSRCLLHPNGTAEPAPGWVSDDGVPFLFDTASMPTREDVCGHCPATEAPPLCCGVCIFESRRCDELHPGGNKTEAAAALLLSAGYQLRAFTPCELFQRVRNRTLWFVGDSQTWHFFYSAECFLRGFAPSLRRTPPVPWALNQKLITVTWPVKVPPICLELALGTRVCAVRVDSVRALAGTVLPLLHHNTPGFDSGVMVYNTGLHYGTPGTDGKPANRSELYRDLTSLVDYKRRFGHVLPKWVWMDTPVQHFSGPDGSYSGGEKPFSCKPLAAWDRGDAAVVAGGRRNAPVAGLVPRFADAHLRTWNASVPFWDSHKPGECTHWCSPSAYHLWLYLLNDVMRDSGLGNPAGAPPRPSMAAALTAAAEGAGPVPGVKDGASWATAGGSSGGGGLASGAAAASGAAPARNGKTKGKGG